MHEDIITTKRSFPILKVYSSNWMLLAHFYFPWQDSFKKHWKLHCFLSRLCLSCQMPTLNEKEDILQTAPAVTVILGVNQPAEDFSLLLSVN